MPLFGAHLSIAGGYHRAVESAVAFGMDTVQLFTHSPSQWAVKPASSGKSESPQWVGKSIGAEEVEAFRTAVKKAKLKFPTAHDSYLINLAAPNDGLFRKSVEAFSAEVERAEALGLAYLVMHPGAHVGSGEDAGLKRVVAGLDEVHDCHPDATVKVLIEITAGQGTTLGYKLEHIATIFEAVKHPERLGVCFDTCHAFAAGYDLRTETGYDATFAEFDRLIGLKKLKLFHLNDSVKPLNSRVDRHAGIGLGHLGEEPFRRIVNDRRFRNLPIILETPKEADDGTEMDPINLAKLRSFVR